MLYASYLDRNFRGAMFFEDFMQQRGRYNCHLSSGRHKVPFISFSRLSVIFAWHGVIRLSNSCHNANIQRDEAQSSDVYQWVEHVCDGKCFMSLGNKVYIWYLGILA